MSQLSTKRCTQCGIIKPLEDYYRDRSHIDGRQAYCKECARERQRQNYRKNMQALKQYQKQYRQGHGEQVAEYKKRWYRDNAEHAAEQSKRRYYTPAGFTSRIWSGLNARTINGSCPNWKNKNARRYLEQGIRLEMARDELRLLVDQNWSTIQAIWLVGETPSIDRIDSEGHYSLDNVRFITMRENRRLGSINGGKATARKRASSAS